ncbi:hypothetical protein [Flavobacterium sp.]|uniref:hypothetical protein n=1 Tax=Flavobacterium sp. TaxID=239 RepID=UPI0031E11CE9
MEIKFWIEKNWGGSIDLAAVPEVIAAFEEMKLNDNQQAAFWIGCHDEEYVLKIQKDQTLSFIYGENQDLELKVKSRSWDEISSLTSLFINGQFVLLQTQISKLTSDTAGQK